MLQKPLQVPAFHICGASPWVTNYDSDRSSSSSWDVRGCEESSFCKESVGTGLTLGPTNGHASQCQRTPVLHMAEQNSSVLPFTKDATCFFNTDFNPFPHGPALPPARDVTISWSFPSRAHPSLWVATQDIAWISNRLCLHGFSCFLPLLMNSSCNSIPAAVPSSLSPCALAAALVFWTGVLMTWPPLDLPVLLWCEHLFLLTQEIRIDIEIEM